MKEQKRHNVIIAVCLMAFILAAVVGVLFSTYQPSTVASAEAAVDSVSENEGTDKSTRAFKCPNHILTIVSVAPTCTTGGYEGSQCATCGVIEKTQEFLPLGHDYSVHVETVNSTCMTYGHTTYKCSRCDSTQTTDLMTTNHKIAERTARTATCNQGGIIEKYCTVCGDVFETIETDPTYDHVNGRIETTGATCLIGATEYIHCAYCDEIIQIGEGYPLGHDFSVEIERVEYCEEYGHVTKKCSRCDVSSTEMTDMSGHDKELIERIEPTCTGEGFTHYKCCRCQQDLYEDYSFMLGHDKVERVLEQANCGFFGRVEVYCSRCGEVFEEYTVDPTYKHNNVLARVEAADCTKPAQNVYECTGCGAWHYEDIGEPLGHDYQEFERIEYCDREGSVGYACSRCTDTYGEILPALGHDYENQIEYHAADCENKEVAIYQCVRCDSTVDKGTAKALGHDISQRKILEASGDYPAIYERYCKRCGEVLETITGEQIFDDGNLGGGSDNDNQGGDNQGSDNEGGDNEGGSSEDDGSGNNESSAPKVSTLKILKICLFFAYVWIAFGLCILCFIQFIKRLKQ